MELMFEIEEVMYEAKAINSLLLAATDAVYNGNYDFGDYEVAFNYIGGLVYKLSERLQQLTDKAFELSNTKNA